MALEQPDLSATIQPDAQHVGVRIRRVTPIEVAREDRRPTLRNVALE
jgi:hypothetical protein